MTECGQHMPTLQSSRPDTMKFSWVCNAHTTSVEGIELHIAHGMTTDNVWMWTDDLDEPILISPYGQDFDPSAKISYNKISGRTKNGKEIREKATELVFWCIANGIDANEVKALRDALAKEEDA